MSHYETLGVPEDADAETIKKAYRRNATKAHPDKGGSVDVLLDPERRRRYDRTWQSDPPKRSAADEMLHITLDALIADHNFHGDYIKAARSNLATGRDRAAAELALQRREANRLEKLLGRVRVNEGKRNTFEGIVGDKLKAARAQVEELTCVVADIEAAIVLAGDYADTVQAAAPDVAVSFRPFGMAFIRTA
jgi:curved DNA-binding protein CbpA